MTKMAGLLIAAMLTAAPIVATGQGKDRDSVAEATISQAFSAIQAGDLDYAASQSARTLHAPFFDESVVAKDSSRL